MCAVEYADIFIDISPAASICIYMHTYQQKYLQNYSVPVRPLGDLSACFKCHVAMYICIYIYVAVSRSFR